MKAIMISIKPEWVAKILNGEKTIEIRKTMPKCELPCKVYIYCTKGKTTIDYIERKGELNWFGNIAEKTLIITSPKYKSMREKFGKVVAEFTLNEVEDFSKWEYDYGALVRHLDLFAGTKGDYPFLNNYLKWQKKGYAWHIDNLKIYNTPKELSKFSSILKRMKGKESRFTSHLLQRPPQSWCYVEELENE